MMSERMKEVGREAKLRTKKLLHIDDTQQKLGRQHGGTHNTIEANSGFNPANILNAESKTAKQILDQLPSKIREVPHLIRHPRSAAEGKTAEQLATSEEPYLSKDDGDRLHDASEKLEEANKDAGLGAAHEDLVRYRNKIVEELLEEQEQKKVAWFSSRYAHRARVLQTGQDMYPVSSPCRWSDEHGQLLGGKWKQWFAQLTILAYGVLANTADTPMQPAEAGSDWDRDMLLQQVERVVMASSPSQKWFMQMRKLQRWTNPTKSGAWCMLWLITWSYNLVFSLVYCIGIYKLLQKFITQDEDAPKQRNKGDSNQEDENEEVETLGELIDRHGSSNWLEPLTESILPVLQPMVKDWADWMEVLTAFWRTDDSRSFIIIIMIPISLLVVSLLASTELCVRLLTLGSILGFFTAEPISHGHPKYVQVLLPLQWIFWNVPTHMEASFRYLRTRAGQITRSTTLSASPGTTITSYGDDVLFATDCHWGSKTGTLNLLANEIRFVQRFPKTSLWTRSIYDLVQLKKGDGKTAVLKTQQNFLELSFQDGSMEKLEQLEDKDKVFNIIIGFSKLTWQQLSV